MPRGKKKEKLPKAESTNPEIKQEVPPPAPVATTPPEAAQVAPKAETSRDEPAKAFSVAHNNAAGLRLLKHSRFKQVQLQFAGDAPPEIREQLEKKHWRFRPEEGVFTKQYGFEGEAAAIISARRLYGELCQKLTRGQGHGTGI